ncbi:hypothetical protein SAZ11_14415 [Streptomyces sp. FXJ1.4098]|nr:hypothetical protein [Streptomyces sp. FXJ1.4098]
MVKSFTEGDFTYEWPLGDGRVYTFFVGGVDFSKAPKRNITPRNSSSNTGAFPRPRRTACGRRPPRGMPM